MKYTILSTVIFLTFSAGCSTSNGPSNSPTWTIPNVGSYYVTRNINYSDSSADSALNTNLHDTSLETIYITGRGPEHGQQNCITADSCGSLAYQTNGDIWGWGCDDDSGWNKFPTGGGKFVDTVVKLPYEGTLLQIDLRTKTYVGTERIALAGNSYSAIRIHEVNFMTNFATDGTVYDTSSLITDYWFVPSIGLEGKDSTSGDGWWQKSELVSFTIH